MFQKMKRFLALFLAVLMIATTIPVDAFAAEIEEATVEIMEQQTDEIVAEDVGEEEIIQEEIVEEEIIVEIYEEVVEVDLAGSQEEMTESAQKVIGFTPLSPEISKIHVVKAGKPTLEQLLETFPKTLEVTFENEQVENIDVSWECVGEDFESSDAYYFQFSPVWDEKKYETEEGFDVITDAPYISIFLYDEEILMGASVTTSSNEEKVFEFLVEEMDLTPAAACGIMANIQHESGFNPKAKGDNGTSYGICQWHNSRWTAMKNWCNGKGYDWTSLNGQLRYLQFELSQNNSKYLWNGKTIYNYMLSVPNSSQGAYDAGKYWCIKFEVPANAETKGKSRGNLARDSYWPEYKKYYEITTPKLSISDTSESISVENSFSLKWTQSVGKFEGYELYIAKKEENSTKYDWSEAIVKKYNKSNREHTVSRMTLDHGSYAAYVVAYKDSKYRSEKSNYIYFNIYSPIVFEEKETTDILYYDATINGVMHNLEERTLSSVGFYVTKAGEEPQRFVVGEDVFDQQVEFRYLLSDFIGELEQLKEYTVQFFAVSNDTEFTSKKIVFKTSYNPTTNFWISEIPDQIYTGKKIEPQVDVYDGERLLVKGVDYTLSFYNNTKVNDASVKKTAPYVQVKGKGNYSGTGNAYFKIIPTDVAVEEFEISEVLVSYNGKKQSPVPNVTFGEKTLKNKTDFTVSYPDLDQIDDEGNKITAYKDPGVYRILVKGKGNFTGTKETVMTIAAEKLISKATVSEVKNQSYTGEEITPDVTVKYGKTTLTKDVDYQVTFENNIEIGTAKAIITGIGAYAGQKSVSFKITGSDISKAKVSGMITSVEYTGEEITQNVTLTRTVNKEVFTLEENEDYIVSYEKNTKAGTATVIFQGINHYSGTLKKTFKILPYNLSTDSLEKLAFEIQSEIVHSKGGAKPKPEVKFGDVTLVEGVDYKLTYKNNTVVNDGTNLKKLPTVTISGKGNFKGNKELNFVISQKELKNLSLSVSDKVYNKKANGWKSSVTLKDHDGKTLAAGKDYSKILVYTYEGNELQSTDIVPAGGVITVTATGMGNYKGEISGSYRVVKSSISSAKIKVKAQYYTGEEIRLEKDEITVSVGNTKLTTEDYEIIEYIDNIQKGTAKVVLEGVGNYGGRKTVEFKIQSRILNWWWLL